MKINKYIPFAFVYFFVNSLALPFGLTYTTLLGPFFYVWILKRRRKEIVLPFIVALAPFILVQVLNPDTVRKVYFYSLFNIVLVYIFCFAVFTFLKTCSDVEKVLRFLLVANFIFCLLAVPFYFTPYYEIFWIEQTITKGISDFRRLKLFTYEASYYSTLFVPLFCFYMLQYLFKQNVMRGWLLLTMIFIPLFFSFSFGVIGALIISWSIIYLTHFNKLTRKRRVFYFVILGSSLLIVGTIVIYLFFRDSFLVTRLLNIISGYDSSGKGRTTDAFILAKRLIEEANPFWGIGPGQIKIAGKELLRDYYLYYNDFVPAIPNAAAETLAVFGWIGLIIRGLIEFFFFFYTRVWNNYFRLWLFIFIFIFQFTGSFITNVAEYVIWILAFTNTFSQFDVPYRARRVPFLLSTS